MNANALVTGAKKLLSQKLEGLRSFGKGLGHALREAPGYLKVHGPLLFNTKALYNLYRMGGHTQGVDAKWHKGLSAFFAGYPLATAATGAALALTAPAALPLFLLFTLAPMPIVLKLNYDVKEAEQEKVTRTNAAGQKVTGTRLDIFRLHKAQQKILRLTRPFNGAAIPSAVQSSLEKAIASVDKERATVTVEGEGLTYRFTGLPKPPAEPPARDLLSHHGAGKVVKLEKPLQWKP
jgi:hypothetical protein